MEGINHVDVVKVGSGSLVGNVDRVFQRKIPYGEGLKLGIASLDAALMLIVELAKANSHLSAARSRSGNNHQRASGFHVIIAPKAFVGINKCHIIGIAINGIMVIGPDAKALQFLTIEFGRALAVIMGNNN